MPIIFFGIWSEAIVEKNINKWIEIAGTPDVFSERDNHIMKYPTKLLGKYDVVSIDEALGRYPDADVWVTFFNPGSVPDMLAEKLPPERIHFLEADLEWRKGCMELGNTLLYREGNFSLCSVGGRRTSINSSDPNSQRLAQWKDLTTELIENIRNERPNRCTECPRLKYGFWRKSVKLNRLIFDLDFKDDACNFKCIYCRSNKKRNRVKSAEGALYLYDILYQMSEMPEYDTDKLTVQLANGDFAANEYCDEILDIFLKTKWKIILNSNLSIYNEKLAALIEDERISRIITSLDAGTRETFKKVKQKDMFDNVLENLRKYPVSKIDLLLGYVFLENINDNETDIDGFYEIVKEVGGVIRLSTDNESSYTKKMKELVLRLTNKAKTDGLKVNVDYSNITLKV